MKVGETIGGWDAHPNTMRDVAPLIVFVTRTPYFSIIGMIPAMKIARRRDLVALRTAVARFSVVVGLKKGHALTCSQP